MQPFTKRGVQVEANPKIIPVAAGKGGVGKSFLTANLAISLAEAGHATVAVDMDFGGSNLHSFLGLQNRYPGIGDYLQARVGNLESLLVPTQLSHLSFLPGDGKTPFMANIPFAQKHKLVSNIKKLAAEYVLIDLGAGSAFNTLDFFNIASKGLVITTPEPPAIMNMLVFLKNYLLRAIGRAMTKNDAVKNHLREVFKRPMNGQITSLKTLQEEIAAEDQHAGKMIGDIFSNCRPRIVFNLGEHPDELDVSKQISKTLSSILCIEADFFGFVFFDPVVRQSVKKQSSVLSFQRNCVAAEGILRIARRIEKYWKTPIKDSARLLQKQTQIQYEAQK